MENEKQYCNVCKKEATDAEYDNATPNAYGCQNTWFINDSVHDDCLICPSCLSLMEVCGFCNEIFQLKESMAVVENKMMCDKCEDERLKCKVCNTWQNKYDTDKAFGKDEDFVCLYCDV